MFICDAVCQAFLVKLTSELLCAARWVGVSYTCYSRPCALQGFCLPKIRFNSILTSRIITVVIKTDFDC